MEADLSACVTGQKMARKLSSTSQVVICLAILVSTLFAAELPENSWTLLQSEPTGARRGSSFRYAPSAGVFVLWGFMNDDPDLLQEQPLARMPEYDVVAFDPAVGKWQNQLPFEWQQAWSKRLPLAYVPRTYAGITTGSERTVLRGPTLEKEGTPRPDLNIVFDQVAYHPPSQSLIYFTGGLTAAYQIKKRHWTDLKPIQSPPPVMAGSLAYDGLHDQMVLFGGGHIVEPNSEGRAVGYTGTWSYSFSENTWHPLASATQPPPRMNTRLVADTKNKALIVFGGDGQSQFLADTWIFDLSTQTWRQSKASAGPEARAGHFTVFDPDSGWIIIGGGYNNRALTDMWAFDAAQDRWLPLMGKVPTGFYLTADFAPEKHLILLTTDSQKPADKMTCNILYPVRTTYGYRLSAEASVQKGAAPAPLRPVAKGENIAAEDPEQATRRSMEQKKRFETLPANQWVLLDNPGRAAPTRTWGTATFDSDRGQILYWGGGHCGYEGNDVDAYKVDAHTWKRVTRFAEYPERLSNHGVRLAGLTFSGGPWTEHGRSIYAHDPISRKLIMVRTIRLTTGYDPEVLRQYPLALTNDYQAHIDGLVNPPSSYVKYATWTMDPDSGEFQLLGPAPVGLDTVVSTPEGVIGLNVNWPRRLNDAGYLLPWNSTQTPEDTTLYRLDVSKREWSRLGERQPSPQNLYERTSLVYDPNLNQILLNGGGEHRNELWSFDLKQKLWKKLGPRVTSPNGAQPPASGREAVFLPKENIMLSYAASTKNSRQWTLWAYHPAQNTWEELNIAGQRQSRMGWNDALVYDPIHDVVLWVAGKEADTSKADVYALRFKIHP